MEKKYKITEKQLAFLEDFLLRKYKDISVETRIELTDHLILDFEATTKNGNLSQYVSNEITFIRKFTATKIKLYKNLYRKETWQYFFSFFKDLRMEVFDHIVSDIEAKMMTENLEFETVFYKVTDTWNKHLRQESSFYFGLTYSLPKIVLEKAKKVYKKWFFASYLFFIIPYILLDKMNINFSKNDLNVFLQILTVCTLMVFFGLLIIKYKEKNKTSFSFILKTLSWNFFIGFIVLFYLNFNAQDDLQSFPISFLAAFIFMTYSYFHFYKKHLEAVKKYKIS